MREPPRPPHRYYEAAEMVDWPDRDLQRHDQVRRELEAQGMTRSRATTEKAS